ncbi:serine/threonine-protein kinase pakD-like [Panonychus citri]|uniref:serine/threonine-protein kinase pakD-like n=1 Tax=Panonychus citri TaxID=50023 RepID=UPI002307E4AA|nr:serine/threonine-protein kinase pakD-like [Panonychus citri]
MIQSKEASSSQATKVPIDFDDEPSGPYIPISECYTGKPVSFKGYPNSNHHLPPPPLPSCSSSSVHHPIHQSHGLGCSSFKCLHQSSASINSPSTGLSLSSSHTLNARKSKPHNLTVGPLSHTLNRHERLSDSNNSTLSLRSRVSKPNGEFGHSSYRNEPPPRPPKPKKLNNRSKSESCSPAYGTNHFNSNDHLSPSTPFNSHLDSPSSPSGQFNPTINSSSNNNINININNIINNNNQHNNQHNNNIVNTPTSQPLTLDDVYDFPKSEPVFNSMRTAIPAPGNRTTKGNSHSYTNAPPGHLSKPPVFTYDYKGTLPVYLDDNTIAFDLDNCDRSPSTPNSAFDSLSSSGSLSKSLTPPAVNRDLKPKRRDSDSDTNVSPTSPTFTLAPPPAHSKSYIKPTRLLNDGTLGASSQGRQFQHHFPRDESNSEEDTISHYSTLNKQNSSLDNQSLKGSPGKSPGECSDVTYLDLDLKDKKTDKDSPNCSDPNKPLSNQPKDLNENCNSSDSQSTVYKSIDFVATHAFHQLRISSHRFIGKK